MYSGAEDKAEEVKPVLVCPPKGFLNLGPCKFDAPMSVSWPHFYKADTNIRNKIEGNLKDFL